MLGGYLLRRAGVRLGLERVRDALALVVLAAGVSTIVAATNGVTAVRVGGDADRSFGSDWLLWWFGDAVGVLLVAPFLLVGFAAARDWSWPARLRLAEGAALLGSLAGVSAIVFLAGADRFPYLIVTDLVAGSGLEFEPRAILELKGVPGEWRLLAARPPGDRIPRG